MPDPFDLYLSSPAVWKGVVYFGSGDGNVYALDAVSGAERWKFHTGTWCMPPRRLWRTGCMWGAGIRISMR